MKTILRKKTKAQSLVEYGLILALVSVVAIAVLGLMGGQIKTTITNINTKLQNANDTSNTTSSTP
jgi:Flp pilus assembly pilin Flp